MTIRETEMSPHYRMPHHQVGRYMTSTVPLSAVLSELSAPIGHLPKLCANRVHRLNSTQNSNRDNTA